jgi:hypothetical protein
VRLAILVSMLLFAAPRGASEPPSTAPALRGAPLYSVVRDTAYIGGRGAADGNTRELTWGLRHPLATVPLVRANSTVPTPVVRGWATYYDVASGHAAAGPLLRTGDWRGRAVTVCAGSACIVTRLTDWCACSERHGIPTLIDLARSDFARLAPPSSGIVLVTVSGATLPNTDMEAQP